MFCLICYLVLPNTWFTGESTFQPGLLQPSPCESRLWDLSTLLVKFFVTCSGAWIPPPRIQLHPASIPSSRARCARCLWPWLCRPEWWPAYGAEVQATQVVCIKGDFPADQLKKETVDLWFKPGVGAPLPEAEGRPPANLSSIIVANWRKHALGPNVWYDGLWRGVRHRVRPVPQWGRDLYGRQCVSEIWIRCLM